MSESMLVYGDPTWSMNARDELEALRRSLRELRGHAGEARAMRLTSDLLVRVGMLSQALLDRQFEQLGMDEVSPLFDACHALLLAFGRMLAGEDADPEPWLGALAVPGQEPLRARIPEGFAQYALYPEQYARACVDALPEHRTIHVLGLRSIGTALGAVVAGSLGPRATLQTLRPTGNPFARELAVGPELGARLLEDRENALYAIVDEGPGLSGSSFHAAMEWLERQGVPSDRVHLFPGHAGAPGARATSEVRRRYARVPKHVETFERTIVDGLGDPPLFDWFPELSSGTPEVCDLSGGQWRALFFACEAEYPASHIQQERRKYLVRSGDELWLVRFLGLGPHTSDLEQRARTLAAHGLVPAIRALAHGFTLAPWIEGVPITCARHDRGALLESLGRYLTLLAKRFRVPSDRAGATVEELHRMCSANVRELLGADAQRELERYRGCLAGLRERARPVAIDGKLDAHEWLVLEGGRVQKTDALDHHLGHDLIGCQDVAWDVAGAAVELDLEPAEIDRLLASMRDGANFRPERDDLRFYELAYLAFRAGHAALARLSLDEHAPREAERMHARARAYTRKLAAVLLSDR